MLQIKAPHFCAGVVLDDEGKVVQCAPILQYMKGWSEERVYSYCKFKGWSVDRISP